MLGSVTDLDARHRGAVVIVGSHGAASTGHCALGHGVGALICHDAGIGLDRAGVGALAVLQARGVPAAAVGYDTARIGDPADMAARGRLSQVNAAARDAGLAAGMTVAEALARLRPAATAATSRATAFTRTEVTAGAHRIHLLDSASLVGPGDAGAILVTGSHGGLPGGTAARALQAPARLVTFNDAGGGIDGAGTLRLGALEKLGIAALCVDAFTARIGEAASSWETGTISAANRQALALGLSPGQPLRSAILALPLQTASEGPTNA